MGFFKKYNGSTNKRLVRMERLTWVLIYGGLMLMVLGNFAERTQASDATEFYLGGGAAVVAGVMLILIRSRLRDDT
ncbi:hypothetical protein [Rhodoferax aquaticus]|uniref:Uncharacterized protein n=1 Tax=Rhodoferax aquaticus TaxID=2527691 RepID=A0A515EPR8_9BURK|nr:hypothetical protein [Rhodoferax aquaticus]QDL54658.1 hypothetical protein EXZ61_11040 [Rhodoferax aquaticus]